MDALQAELDARLYDIATLPPEAEALCAGEWNDDAHRKELMGTTTEYVVRVAPYAFVSRLAKRNVRRLLGLGPEYTLNLVWGGCWKSLQDGVRAKMHAMGAQLDRTYRRLKLREQLGHFPQVHRQVRQYVPAQCSADKFADKDNVVANNDLECIYIHFLRLLALALNATFQARVAEVIQLAGIQLVGGAVRSVTIKSYERMWTKLNSWNDHWNLAKPRPQHNLDVMRCLLTFRTVDDFKTAVDVIGSQVFEEGFAVFKNGMAWDAAEATKHFHLRLVLGVGLIAHPSRSTMGELRGDPNVQKLWDEYVDTEPVFARIGRATWRRHIETALEWLQSVPGNTNIKLYGEVQMLLQEYTATRCRMHELYKIARASDQAKLHADFARHEADRRAELEFAVDGDTRLKLACRDGSEQALSRLLGDDTTDEEIDGALNVACKHAQPACVKLLLERVSSAKALGEALRHLVLPSRSTRTCAADKHRYTLAEWLVHAKASLDAGAARGRTTLWCAADSGFSDIVRLLGQCRDVGEYPKAHRALRNACMRGQTEVVGVLIGAKVDIAHADSDGRCAAWIACEHGHYACLLLLLNAGADVDAASSNGSTPACIAAENGRHSCLQLLCGAKADLNQAKNTGATPAWMAAQNGHDGCLQLLCGAKADLNQAKNDGATPAFMAAQNGHLVCVRASVAARADLNKPTRAGATAVLVAAYFGRVQCLQVLLEAKAEVWRASPVWSAVERRVAREHPLCAEVLGIPSVE